MPLPQTLSVHQSSSQNPGERLLRFTSSLKDMIKDTDGQAAGELHRARSGRTSSAGVWVPMELGYITSLVLYFLIWKLSKPHTAGILWWLPHVDIIGH